MPLPTPPPLRPLISFLSDFGTRDPWVAICRGVILSIAPDVRLIDVTHEIAPYDVQEGALTLAAALPELPVGTHLAVVDPGVGGARRPVGIRTGRGDVLVGPDNGLLPAAAAALGGIIAVHELRDPRFRRATTSRTFHGRDVFAPAAAHLAQGVPLEELGPPVAPDTLVSLAIPGAERRSGTLRTAVLAVDEFGNLQLAGDRSDLEAVLGPLLPGDPVAVALRDEDGQRRHDGAWAEAFGDVRAGALLVYEDSLRRLAIAVNRGSAAQALGVGTRAVVELRRP